MYCISCVNSTNCNYSFFLNKLILLLLIGLSCSNPKYLSNDFAQCLADCSNNTGTYGNITANVSNYTCNNCNSTISDCISCINSTYCNYYFFQINYYYFFYFKGLSCDNAKYLKNDYA